MNPSALTQVPPSVPVEYAEKAMGSLMKLHGELMEEKERRVDLYRRLMEKEQALAELKMYVKLLEEKVAPPAAAVAVAPAPVAASRPEPLRMVPPVPAAERRSPSTSLPVAAAAPRVVPRPPPPPVIRAATQNKAPTPIRTERQNVPLAPPPKRTADGWKSW